MIEFDNLKTMDEVIHQARIYYQQSKQKGEAPGKRGTNKRNNRLARNNKGSRTGGTARPPVQCWGCGGPHYVKNYPQGNETKHVSQIHEALAVDDIGCSLPRINATLEGDQAKYQLTMVEFEGKISHLTVIVLIDPSATLSYISPKIFEQCKFQTVKFRNPWLVQLATGVNRRVLAKVDNCPLKLVGQSIKADLNVLPLGSYDVLIAMDWLEKHWSLVNCKTKTIYYRDELRTRQELQGNKRAVQIRPITASKLVKGMRKGCQMYAIQVGYTNSKDKMATLDNIPVIQEFADVFPEEIPGLSPKRDMEFTIELVPGVASVSQAPYRMSTPKFIELKM
eukprot:PITA_29500